MNKRGIVKTGIGFLILLILTLVILLIYSSSAIIQQETYLLGEKVKIDLRGIENYTIKIITPSNTYIKEGSNDVFIFKPEEAGDYRINLFHKGRNDFYEFKVFDNKNNTIRKIEHVPNAESKPLEIPKNNTREKIQNLENEVLEQEMLSFSSSQEPYIEFNHSPNNSKMPDSFIAKSLRLFAKDDSDISIYNAKNEKIEQEYLVQSSESKSSIQIKNSKTISPGIYTVELEKDGKIYEQEFVWGLISLNTKKSIYKPGETAELEIVLLDSEGRGVRGEVVLLQITDPTNNDKVIDVTENASECGLYHASYKAILEGEYKIDLSTTEDEIIKFSSTFLVQQEYSYEIIRNTKSKIDPTIENKFNVKINIESLKEGINGLTIKEYLPEEFEVYGEGFEVKEENDVKVLTWDIKGKEAEIQYSYSVPLVWPYLYELGPLQVNDFEEFRPWYVAVDPNIIVDTQPSVDIALTALDNRTFIVSWVDNVENDVSFIIYDTNGTNLTSTVDADTTADGNSRVALSIINSTHFLLGWYDGPSDNITYAAYNRTGVNTTQKIQAEIGGIGGINSDISLASMGDRFQYCYMDDGENDADLRSITYASLGTGTETNIDGSAGPALPLQNLVSCAPINDTVFVYSWYDDNANDASFQVLNKSASALVGTTDLDTGIGETAQLAVTTLNNNAFAIGWFDIGGGDTGSIEFSIRTANNTIIVSDTFVDSNAGSSSRIAMATVKRSTTDQDNFIIAWNDQNASSIEAVAYNASGSLLYGPYTLASDENTTSLLFDIYARNPAANISLCDGSFVFAYTNISGSVIARTLNLDGTVWDGNCGATDTTPPTVSLVSPANNSLIATSFDLEFIYNVADTSSMNNCSLHINSSLVQSDNSVTKDINQSFFHYLDNGIYNWAVQCYDLYNNSAITQNRTANISINEGSFSQRFYETSNGSFTSSQTANIKLNNSRDNIQDTASFDISPQTLEQLVQATSQFMKHNGAIIPSGTTIAFSSSFTVASANVEATWKLYITNSSGDTLLCQNGDDGSGGTPTAGTISSSNTTCINRDIRLQKSDRIKLIVDGYNTHATATRSVTHAWDASTSSYVDINITTEGFLRANLSFPTSDPNVALSGTFNASCAVYCSIGTCRNTSVYIQQNISTSAWADINATSGNLILNTGETNPHYLGNVSTTALTTNFTLRGNVVSVNNIRCRAVSSYDSINSSSLQITVGGAAPTAPAITLINPANATWLNTSQAILYYNVSDVNNNLANSTLILNGQRNQTNQSALLNSQINNFTIALPDGVYTWTVNATDTTNLEGTNASTTTFYVDTQKPVINLNSPSIDQVFQVSTVEFNFTAIDNMDSTLLCNLTIDSTVRDSNFNANNGSLLNRTITPVSIGNHLWNVTCVDETGNTNTSITRNFTIQDLPPTVDLITVNNSFSNTGNITLIYNATDNNGFLQSQLILNNQINQTNQSAILNGQYNNFSLTNLAEGIYTWNVNVTDTSGLNATNSSRTFTIDKTLPSIALNLPANNTISNSSTVNFNFTVLDNIDTSLTCNLAVGERQDSSFAAANGSLTNRQITSFTDGGRYWNVTCTDDAGNTNMSEIRFVNITEKPLIALNTANNSFFNYSSFNLSYTPSDNTNLSSCSLFIDGDLNKTNSSIVNNQQNNFSLSSVSEGLHTWYVSCNDTIQLQNQSEIRTFTVDLDGLTVTLDYPTNDLQLFTSLVNFTFNATDNLDAYLECDITVNSQIVNTSLVTSGALTTRNVTFSQGGLKVWNVTCTDDASNRITSLTRNFTLAFSPTISLVNPANNIFQNTSTIAIYYNVTDDNNNLANSTLILNGQRNQTNQSALLNSQINNFTITLPDGIYNWTVNVTDLTNLQSTNISIRTFTIDTLQPSINLNLPINNSIENWNNITFNFTVLDNIDSSLTCNLSMDGSPEILNFNAANGTEEIKYLVKQDGSYLWDVSCTDDAGNLNISQTRNFTIEAPPNVTLQVPNNENITNVGDITFIYLPSDPIGINNCSLFIDDIINVSTDTVNNNQNNSFTVNNIAEGRHNWTVECTDVFPDLNFFKPTVRNFTFDITPPNVTLNLPLNSTNALRTVEFNFSALDSLDADLNLSCNLYIDNSLNQSNFNITNGFSIINTVSGHSLGTHNWNVSCMDDARNLGWSQKWQYNVTLTDLMVNASSIVFNTTSPVENQTVLINATIYNLINVTVTNITVAFYNGDPQAGGTQIGQNQTLASLSPLSSGVVSVNWNAVLGTNTIFTVADPPFSSNGSIEEWLEGNNKANNSITIGAWQFVYGDINSQSKFDLADSSNNSVIRWESVNFESGNVYVADSESSILWSNLKAIGKNLTEGNSLNDFSDLDSLLSMTNYIDSISALYLNSSGNIINTTNLLIFNAFIYSTPIANSTNNTNFFTGILWDTSDNNITNNGQFDTTDKEDIVFLTQINKDKAGAYGIYDYEMRIPARLREYRTAQTSSVIFYTEIS